jgi:hypothetical protein
MRTITIAAALLALTGCAATPAIYQYQWQGKPWDASGKFASKDAALDALNADAATCPGRNEDVWHQACLAGHGWVLSNVTPANAGSSALGDAALMMLMAIGGAAQSSNDRVNQGIEDRRQYLRDSPPPAAPVTCTSSRIGDQLITRCR